MKKVFWKKLATTLIAAVAVVLMLVAVYAIGFQFKQEGTDRLTLDKLKELKDNPIVGGIPKMKDHVDTTYALMMSGWILSLAAVALLLISTIFGRLFFALDRILWGGGLFVLIIGLVLLVAGEGYFADQWPGNGLLGNSLDFKELFNQGTFAGMLICSIAPSLIAVGMGAASFSKQSSKKK